MVARVGDRIVIESERVGQKDREGEILEVFDSPLGANYRVRWDDGHESEIRPRLGSARFVPTKRPRKSPAKAPAKAPAKPSAKRPARAPAKAPAKP